MDSEQDGRTSDGSLDGRGAGDHDKPYRFGYRPCASVPYPFSTRQYARLLILRSRVQAGLFAIDPSSLAVATDQTGHRQHTRGQA